MSKFQFINVLARLMYLQEEGSHPQDPHGMHVGKCVIYRGRVEFYSKARRMYYNAEEGLHCRSKETNTN
jgi:hypothetical protein